VGLELHEAAPDHSNDHVHATADRSGNLLSGVHGGRAAFGRCGLVKGMTIGIDATTPEASRRSIVRRDMGKCIRMFSRG
jgi:hypothetical protein